MNDITSILLDFRKSLPPQSAKVRIGNHHSGVRMLLPVTDCWILGLETARVFFLDVTICQQEQVAKNKRNNRN
jgi:hypothetical protein